MGRVKPGDGGRGFAFPDWVKNRFCTAYRNGPGASFLERFMREKWGFDLRKRVANPDRNDSLVTCDFLGTHDEIRETPRRFAVSKQVRRRKSFGSRSWH